MSVSFVARPIAVKLAHPTEDGAFIRAEGADEDYLFDLYAIDGPRALVLNEHELTWVDLDRVHVILAEEQPDGDSGPPETA